MAPRMDDRPLDGRLAVVTGGAAGIGGGISRLFAAAGATVVINDVDDRLLRSTYDDITAAGGRAVRVLGDIREATTVTKLVEAAREIGGGRIDVLVNDVGDYRPV